MNWHWYTRGTVHLDRLAIAMTGSHKYGGRLNGVVFDNVLYANINGKLWWAWNEKEIANLGQVIIKKCSFAPSRDKHQQRLERLAKQAINKAGQSLRVDLKKLSNRQLAEFYQTTYESFEPAHALLNADIDAIDLVFEKFLQTKLKKALPVKHQYRYLEIYKQLTAPLYLSYTAMQERSLILLALKNKAGSEDIQKIHSQYWWTALGWENMRPHNPGYFLREINKLRKFRDLKHKLRDIDRYIANTRRDRKKIVKRYNIAKIVIYWLKFFDRYAYLHDLRKEMQMKTIYAYYRVLLEAQRRFGYRAEDLEWLWPREVIAMLKGKKFDQAEARRRSQKVFARVYKQKIVTVSGPRAEQLLKKELKASAAPDSEIKGLGVTLGKITGTAKICSGLHEALRKIKTGDVLVCGMTLPDYLPAMKKAAAIVTNEGGITCHAAIVCRELKKICVVGTKTATEVLKDGDMVEVDADHGVVRKIK